MITATFTRIDTPNSFTKYTVVFSADWLESVIDGWGQAKTNHHFAGLTEHLGTLAHATEYKRQLKAKGVKVTGSLAAPKAAPKKVMTEAEKAAYSDSWLA
jgi:hypothetical protein